MRKINNQGISLIALIITIAIIVIIAAVTIQNGLQRTNEAQMAKHNTNISTIQEEVESYYYYAGGKLPIANLTPYIIKSGTTLYSEIEKNGEQEDNFYVINMSKLGKISGKEGTGIGEDIYIVSEIKHNIYYVAGTTIKGLVYHGLAAQSAGNVAQVWGATPTTASTSTPTNSPTPTLTPTLTPSPTPVPGSGYFDGMVNSPKLATGMIPIRWTGTGNTYADLNATEQLNENSEWYDYRNTGGTANKWANIRLKDGSMLVWIPRYTYEISSGFHSSTAGNINIRFSNGTTDDTTGGYRVHPAFYWGGWNIPISADMTKVAGGTELTGIWVGKFEPTNNSSKIKIQAATISWRTQSVDNIFTACRAMQTTNSATYGISTDTNVIDTHMLKRSEWGAVAYLSKYALGATEVTANNDNGYLTANGNIITYKSQSTTGNEYGIYDMSGCGNEYVAAYVNNATGNLTNYGSALVSSNAKYKDVFPKATSESQNANYNAVDKAYGYALYETSSASTGSTSWFGDYSYFPYSTNPFFLSGGFTSGVVGIFYFYHGDGVANVNNGFRVAIIVT